MGEAADSVRADNPFRNRFMPQIMYAQNLVIYLSGKNVGVGGVFVATVTHKPAIRSEFDSQHILTVLSRIGKNGTQLASETLQLTATSHGCRVSRSGRWDAWCVLKRARAQPVSYVTCRPLRCQSSESE
jgi:hypothetical protein